MHIALTLLPILAATQDAKLLPATTHLQQAVRKGELLAQDVHLETSREYRRVRGEDLDGSILAPLGRYVAPAYSADTPPSISTMVSAADLLEEYLASSSPRSCIKRTIIEQDDILMQIDGHSIALANEARVRQPEGSFSYSDRNQQMSIEGPNRPTFEGLAYIIRPLLVGDDAAMWYEGSSWTPLTNSTAETSALVGQAWAVSHGDALYQVLIADKEHGLPWAGAFLMDGRIKRLTYYQWDTTIEGGYSAVVPARVVTAVPKSDGGFRVDCIVTERASVQPDIASVRFPFSSAMAGFDFTRGEEPVFLGHGPRGWPDWVTAWINWVKPQEDDRKQAPAPLSDSQSSSGTFWLLGALALASGVALAGFRSPAKLTRWAAATGAALLVAAAAYLKPPRDLLAAAPQGTTEVAPATSLPIERRRRFARAPRVMFIDNEGSGIMTLGRRSGAISEEDWRVDPPDVGVVVPGPSGAFWELAVNTAGSSSESNDVIRVAVALEAATTGMPDSMWPLDVVLLRNEQ